MANETDLGVRVRGKRIIGTKRQAIECDDFDLTTFRSIKNQSEELRAQETKYKPKLPTFREFHQDVYDSLYKYVPKSEKSGSMKPGFETNHTIIQQLLGDNMYKELRSYTSLNEFNAAMATKVLSDHMAAFLPDVKRMPQKGKKDDPASRKPDPKKLKQAIRQGMQGAKGDCQEMEQATTCWGSGPGMPQKLGYKDKLALAQRIRKSRMLKQLAKICGRFRAVALSTQRTKIAKGNEEVYSIEIGDDISRMLPQQLAYMTHPVMRLEFLGKVIKKELMQFKLRSRKKETQGPIVCCIDNSGSMGGDREVWAKAVALGLLEICVLQRREFVGIHFGSASETRVYEFDHSSYTLDQVLDFAEFFFGGGTDFEKPMDLAADHVGKMPRADIVMITDGECDVNDKWLRGFNDWRDENEVSVYGVLIDPYAHHNGGDHSTMKKFCNGGVHMSKDLADEKKALGSAANIFGFV